MSGQLLENRLLAFLQSQLGVNSDVCIHQICQSNFTKEEICSAKNLLNELLNIEQEIPHSTGHKMKDLAEIIELLVETDPEKVPTFVAKLPKFTILHGVTKLFEDLTTLEESSANIESLLLASQFTIWELRERVAKLHGLCSENMMAASKTARRLSINSQSSFDSAVTNWSLTTLDTAPLALFNMDDASSVRNISSSSASTCNTLTNVTASKKTLSNATSKSSLSLSATADKTFKPLEQRAKLEKRHNLAEQSHENLEQASHPRNNDEDGFIKVERKKQSTKDDRSWHKPKKILRPWTTLFVSPLPFNRKAEDVVDYIQYKTKLILKVEKLESREKVRYSSFAVSAPTDKLGIFLKEGFWSKGVVCRKFSDIIREAKEQRLGLTKKINDATTDKKLDKVPEHSLSNQSINKANTVPSSQKETAPITVKSEASSQEKTKSTLADIRQCSNSVTNTASKSIASSQKPKQSKIDKSKATKLA